MPRVCLYFQLHQPYRLGDYSVFELGDTQASYFDSVSDHNRAIFTKVAKKSYLPMLQLLLKLVSKYPDFKVAFSCSGVFLEQAQEYYPEVISLLQDLAESRQVEFLSETYYHSLASLYDEAEFKQQVALHQQLTQELFKRKPSIFRNTELIYSDAIGAKVAQLGFKGILTEAVPRYLNGISKTQLAVDSTGQLPIMLKHAELSDDIAFRFSDKHWVGFPLTAEKYSNWLHEYGDDDLINLFMDFETFGEHQWESTGIFAFFEKWVALAHTDAETSFVLPSEVCTEADIDELPIYHVAEPISWADIDRDISAWIENEFQQDTLDLIYALHAQVLSSKDPALLDDWRKLQTSDHFYYMCTKWSADGDVHAYFSPFESPFEAYRKYATVLHGLRERVFVANKKNTL